MKIKNSVKQFFLYTDYQGDFIITFLLLYHHKCNSKIDSRLVA